MLGVTLWAPAAWLRPFIPAELACGDLTGTVWQGECRAAERINSFGARSELGRLRWKLSTSALFRLTLEADLLQLSPASRAGGSRVDLLQQGYRPWSLLLRWDFRRPRPEIDCSGPPDPKQPGRDLFDPKMRKRYRFQ